MAFTKITNAGFGLTTGTLVGVAASFSSTVSVGGTLTYEDVTNVDSVGLITARNGIEVTDKGVQVGTGATVDSAGDNILTFLTNGSERVRVTSGGNIGINSTNPGYLLDIASGSASMRLNSTSTSTLVITSGESNAARIEFGDLANNDTGYIYYDNSDDSMQFATNGSTEALRIDSSQRLLIGTTSAVSTQWDPNLQVVGSNTPCSFVLARNDTTVGADSTLAAIRIFGNDSNGTYEECARISAESDLDHGTGDKPTRLVFSTTADGASTVTERLRIESDGTVGVLAGDLEVYGTEGVSASLYLIADEGDDNGDGWRINSNQDVNDMTIANNTSGSYVDKLTLTTGGDLTASGNVTAYSDISLKENIETIPNALDKVLNLRGVEFDRTDTPEKQHQIGVIAQEVEEIVPEVVLEDKHGIKSVAYGNLVGLLIESIKELKAEVNDLKAQLEG